MHASVCTETDATEILQVARKTVRGPTSSEGSSGSEADTDSTAGGESELENWVDWIRRATHTADQHARRAKVSDWVEEQRRRYFCWAGHIAKRKDCRWSRLVLDWIPPEGKRKVGHPKQRWADKLVAFLTAHNDTNACSWTAVAADRQHWARLTEAFVKQDL